MDQQTRELTQKVASWQSEHTEAVEKAESMAAVAAQEKAELQQSVEQWRSEHEEEVCLKQAKSKDAESLSEQVEQLRRAKEK
eukprot:g30591.t1